jgi:hypothetical protein
MRRISSLFNGFCLPKFTDTIKSKGSTKVPQYWIKKIVSVETWIKERQSQIIYTKESLLTDLSILHDNIVRQRMIDFKLPFRIMRVVIPYTLRLELELGLGLN